MVKEDKSSWKANYFKIADLGMQQIRSALTKTAVVLMGKNTMMRKAIRGHLDKNPSEKVLPYIVGNISLVFTKGDLIEVRELPTANKVKAPVHAGAIAPGDVVPKQATTLGSEKTSFFQALQITTKITKGCIEIIIITKT